ncbi:hypothetical protein CAL14_04970 [Bordetella genomosp. 9]|nr:hypothetical protein CAL14_04970 [Bordetella genomosp. 9]
MPQKNSTSGSDRAPAFDNTGQKAAAFSNFCGVPVIDVGPLIRPGSRTAMLAVMRQIREACNDNRLFYLAGHGISPGLLRAVYLSSAHFFLLDAKFKNIICSASDGRGYLADKRSIFKQAALASSEPIYAAADTGPFRYGWNKGGPAAPMAAKRPCARSTGALVERYYREVFALCRNLLKGCAIAQGKPADAFRVLYRHPVLYARLQQYGGEDKGLGIRGERHDQLVILWGEKLPNIDIRFPSDGHGQEDGAGIAWAGPWVLRVGDIMARWSNDLLVAAPHLVTTRGGRTRYCVPVFFDEGERPALVLRKKSAETGPPGRLHLIQ